MATGVTLYSADPETLPCSLPTTDSIESASEILSETGGSKVVKIGDHFVVKYGLQVDLLEGETMLFLREATRVPVPKVYALFRDGDTQKKYIVMEYIAGKRLDELWQHMDQTSKEAVASSLKSHFEEIRNLNSPGGYCSLGCRGLPDGIFWTSDPAQPFNGPFENETELNEAMLSKYLSFNMSKHKADYYSVAFREVYQGHPPTFTHGDFQRKNIIVRDCLGSGCENNGGLGEVVLIDWEFAGWYPSYWEYAKAVYACGGWKDNWSSWIDRILEPARNEYVWMNMLVGEMWS